MSTDYLSYLSSSQQTRMHSAGVASGIDINSMIDAEMTKISEPVTKMAALSSCHAKTLNTGDWISSCNAVIADSAITSGATVAIVDTLLTALPGGRATSDSTAVVTEPRMKCSTAWRTPVVYRITR